MRLVLRDSRQVNEKVTAKKHPPHGISPLIPLCGLFLLRTSAIQASLIALGLASDLLSPFSFFHFPMEWLKIKTSTELVRVRADEIVYVRADGNYSDLMLTSGRKLTLTFQLHFF